MAKEKSLKVYYEYGLLNFFIKIKYILDTFDVSLQDATGVTSLHFDISDATGVTSLLID